MAAANKDVKGANNPAWRGGRKYHSRGYIFVYSPHHPRRNVDNYVLEHRLVMEGYIGRFLLPEEVVHHINGILDDNRIENLILFPSQSVHRATHKGYKKKRSKKCQSKA